MYYSSSAASSIYSQDGVIFPAPYDSFEEESDLKPLIERSIERKDSSASALSKSSNLSQASTLAPTIYTEDFIKTLGYRPFEYWKGPLPVASALDRANDGKRKRTPVPPPPRALNRHSRAFRNSLRALKPGPLPPARLKEPVQLLMEKPPLPPRRPRPPPSPRVKDRYKHRYKLPRKEGEWPGWEPDESVVRYFATRFAETEKANLSGKGEMGLKKSKSSSIKGNAEKKTTTMTTKKPKAAKKKKGGHRFWSFSNTSNASTHSSHKHEIESDSGSIRLFGERERFFKPQTWTRRSWGLVALLSMLLLGAILILASTLARGNDSHQPQQTAVMKTETGTRPDDDIFTIRLGAPGGTAEDTALLLARDWATTVAAAATVSRRAVHGGSLFRFGPVRHTL